MCEQQKNKPGKSTIWIGLSFICAVHCLATPVLVALMPVAGHSVLHNPLLEFGLIAASIVFAGSILFKDKKIHGNIWPVLLAAFAFAVMLSAQILHDHSIFISIVGALLLIAAYVINWRSFHAPFLKKQINHL